MNTGVGATLDAGRTQNASQHKHCQLLGGRSSKAYAGRSSGVPKKTKGTSETEAGARRGRNPSMLNTNRYPRYCKC